MADVFLQLIAAAFQDHAGASRALEAVLRARARLPQGILDAVAVTRAGDGSLLLQGAAERTEGTGFAVSPVTGVVLGLLEGGGPLEAVSHQAPWLAGRHLRALKAQLRDVSALLTPASSALVTVVGPSGAAEVAGVVLDQAVKLAVEDLPGETVLVMASEPALLFADGTGGGVLCGRMAAPHPAFASRVVAAQPLG